MQELYRKSERELDVVERCKLTELLLDITAVFSTGPDDLGKTTLVEHEIQLKSRQQIKLAAQKMDDKKQRDTENRLMMIVSRVSSRIASHHRALQS